jgi:hypothetical protein
MVSNINGADQTVPTDFSQMRQDELDQSLFSNGTHPIEEVSFTLYYSFNNM